jgi:hypothetical protein
VVLANTLIHGAAATMTASKNVFIFDVPSSLERSHGADLEPAASALQQTHSLSGVLLPISS